MLATLFFSRKFRVLGVYKRKVGQIEDVVNHYGIRRPITRSSRRRLVRLLRRAGYHSYNGHAWSIGHHLLRSTQEGRRPLEKLPPSMWPWLGGPVEVFREMLNVQ